MGFFSKIRGTFETIFQLGKGGPQLKNSAGVIEGRDPSDAAYAIVRGLDPVANNDLVTLGYFNNNNAVATGLTYAKMPLALATKVSTSAIPDNADIRDVVVDVTTAYDASATFDAKRTGDATVIPFAAGDVDWATIGTYHVPQIQNWGSTGTGTLTCTLTNIPTVGDAVVYIGYVTPTDIS